MRVRHGARYGILLGVRMTFRVLLITCFGSALLACGDSSMPPEQIVVDPKDPVERTCEDADGDGYGENCAMGKDCDDDDPENTDFCRRCKDPESAGCPCDKGTRAIFCKPPDMEVEGGTLVCDEGTRYCVECDKRTQDCAGEDEEEYNVWDECQIIGDYYLVKD